MTRPRRGLTRIAPTPSGFLHEGNVATFRATADLASELGLDLALRIDDADAARSRPAYIEDIFRVLDLLGIAWQVGPRTATEFAAHWSQRHRTESYRQRLEQLRDGAVELYACACSRRELGGAARGGCSGRCWERALVLREGSTCLRVRVPPGTTVEVGGCAIDISDTIGDAVLWRRDDLPAYHLVSIVEDAALGTTHIVRGADLLESSAFQIWLAQQMGAVSVAEAAYLHLPLILDADGAKLSKSQLGEHARPWTLSP